ncbi:MAG: hypothetical protein ACOC3F_03780, partial [Desulfosudaceae bacterium]
MGLERWKRISIRFKLLLGMIPLTAVMITLMFYLRLSALAYWSLAAILLITLGAFTWFMLRGLLTTVQDVITIGKKLAVDIAEAQNDLTARVHEPDRSDRDYPHDEQGELAKWFNKFMKKMQLVMKVTRDQSFQMDEAASQLVGLTEEMMKLIENNRAKSNAVASAAEEMNANMETVSETMDNAAGNVKMVASSTEEMSATITEVAKNSENASRMTESAVSQATAATRQVEELGRAAREIGEVLET